MDQVVRKTAARGKPKSEKNASAKRVKRATRSTTAAKRATQSATSNASRNWRDDSSANSVMKMSTDAISQMFKNGASETQNQIMSFMNKESAAQFAKSADAASRSMGEMLTLSRDNVEACVACSNIAVNASKHMGAELFNFANKSFSQNVELSKELLACRTLNDMFDLQSRVMKTNLDNIFNESVKMSELLFECATQVSEPINERVSETASRLSKTLADAA